MTAAFALPVGSAWLRPTGVFTARQLDLAFEEDEHPWIEAQPRGALAIALRRLIAGSLPSLFRSVTQRSDERRRTPWRTLMPEPVAAAPVARCDQRVCANPSMNCRRASSAS